MRIFDKLGKKVNQMIEVDLSKLTDSQIAANLRHMPANAGLHVIVLEAARRLEAAYADGSEEISTMRERDRQLKAQKAAIDQENGELRRKVELLQATIRELDDELRKKIDIIRAPQPERDGTEVRLLHEKLHAVADYAARYNENNLAASYVAAMVTEQSEALRTFMGVKDELF